MELRWSAVLGVPRRLQEFPFSQKEDLLAGSVDIDETMVEWVSIHPDHLELFRLVPPEIQVLIDLPDGRVDSIIDGLVLHARSHKNLHFHSSEGVHSVAGIEFLDNLEILKITRARRTDLTHLQMVGRIRSLTLADLDCEELDLSCLAPGVDINLIGFFSPDCRVGKLRVSTRTSSVKIVQVPVRTIVAVEDPASGSCLAVLPRIETDSAVLFYLASSSPGVTAVIDNLIFPFGDDMTEMKKKRVHARNVMCHPLKTLPNQFSFKGITTDYLRSLTIVSCFNRTTIQGFEFLDTARHLVRVKLARRNETNIQNLLAWGESRGFSFQEEVPRARTYRVFVRTVEDSPDNDELPN